MKRSDLTTLINSKIHLPHITPCSIQTINMHIFVLNGALRNMRRVYHMNCESGLFAAQRRSNYRLNHSPDGVAIAWAMIHRLPRGSMTPKYPVKVEFRKMFKWETYQQIVYNKRVNVRKLSVNLMSTLPTTVIPDFWFEPFALLSFPKPFENSNQLCFDYSRFRFLAIHQIEYENNAMTRIFAMYSDIPYVIWAMGLSADMQNCGVRMRRERKIPHPVASEHRWSVKTPQWIHSVPDVSSKWSWRCGCNARLWNLHFSQTRPVCKKKTLLCAPVR